MKKKLILVNEAIRSRAIQIVREAPLGYIVTVGERTRSLDQNDKFHAICGDMEKSGLIWCGRERSLAEWKVLLVSGHAKATSHEVEVVPGIEEEPVSILEATHLMTVSRMRSLIEYALSFCALNGITVRDGVLKGWEA